MKQNIFKSIADLRFAIFILLMIAGLSVIGTVIEQDQSIETYNFQGSRWIFKDFKQACNFKPAKSLARTRSTSLTRTRTT